MSRQLETPLFSALERRARQEKTAFHMPGNRGGRAFPLGYQSGFASLETTELADNDDLNRPFAQAKEAEELAAELFGAEATLFFSAGSTCAISVMLAAACPPGSQLLLSPTVHMSVYHAAAYLDLKLKFLPLQSQPTTDTSPIPKIDLESCAALLRNEAAHSAALLLCSPDYYGCCEAVGALAELCQFYQLPLLVDEAHGAHFILSKRFFPAPALAQGASMVVQSAHKTLAALTPASSLHIGATELAQQHDFAGRARRWRPVFQSSSPSFPIVASLDYARARLAQQRSSLSEQSSFPLLERITTLKANLPQGYKLLRSADPLRLVLDYRGRGQTYQSMTAYLQKVQLEVELCDWQRLVLICACDQDIADFSALSQKLERIPLLPATSAASAAASLTSRAANLWQELSLRQRPASLRPRPYLFAQPQTLQQLKLPQLQAKLEAGSELYNCNCLGLYPPGIPLLLPGEKLEPLLLQQLSELTALGFNMVGTAAAAYLVFEQ